MKVGCQDHYEHCIKSVKTFNQPRISITFRQLEAPLCYFIYDPSTYEAYATSSVEQTRQARILTILPQGVHLGIVTLEESEIFAEHGHCTTNLSLLKSNLQKAIRRKEKDIALHTTMRMILNGTFIDLLRRLTIITFEDVILNSYYPAIVWYYVALSTKSYQLTYHDVIFLYSYVGFLCDLNETTYANFHYKGDVLSFEEVNHHTMALSLFLRAQYGGFDGEINAMNDLIQQIIQGNLLLSEEEITLLEPVECVDVTILDAAIDFHCFPSMLKRVCVAGLSEDDAKRLIWTFDSSVNARKRATYDVDDKKVWKNVLQPACQSYRAYIRGILK
jgi:hypothetical protein